MATDPLPESEVANGKHKVDSEPAGDNHKDVHDRALSRFDSVAVPQSEMRADALAARRFVTIPGAMWEGQFGDLFENAPRPEIDKITPSLEKIETDYRENRITSNFLPATGGDADTAETLNGMYRADASHFKAQQSRDNALQEGLRGGMGAWRITTDYADSTDPKSDEQRVNPGRTIVDADQSVYFDGASILYDKSDAKWAFVVTAKPKADAQREWGMGADWPTAKLNWVWDWYTPETALVAEYYEVEESPDRLLIFTNKATDEQQRYFDSEITAKESADLVAQGWKRTSRPANRPRVHKYILNGTEVVKDCGYIAGPNIPIVPYYGRRDFLDNMERFRGHVAKRMDANRVYNAAVGSIVEANSLSPVATPILYDDEISQDLADEWARRNIDRLPYLRRIRTFTPDGQPIPSQIEYIQPPQLAPATVAALQQSGGDLSNDDDSTEQVKANTSEGAMDLAASRVDAKSGIYLDNMRLSEQRSAEIYLGMAREVYFEPGRKVETLSIDGKDGDAELMQTHLDEQGVYKTRNDLSQGAYKIVADVQESTGTKRQRVVRQSMDLASVATQAQDVQLAQAALLTAVMNQDGEGMQDMQAFARSRLIALGVVKPNKEEQQQIDQAAQQPQQPSPQDQALMSLSAKDESVAKLNQAKAVQTLADAHLKTAQAEVVGGPDAAPIVPTGLDHAHGVADVASKLAGAALKSAQAKKIDHDISLGHRGQDLAERAQNHTERTAALTGEQGA